MDQRLALLREGYVKDVIDLETFERFVGLVLEGGSVKLPYEVLQLGVRFGATTDAPGQVLAYRPAIRRVIRETEKARPRYIGDFTQILKGESGFNARHDWGDGKGAVHSISLDDHKKNLRITRAISAHKRAQAG